MTPPLISFTPQNLKLFKREYQRAIASGETSFTFKGREVLVAYAKYMIEYLETVRFPHFKGRRR